MINRHLATIAIITLFVSSLRGEEKAKSIKRTFEITLEGVMDTDQANKKDHVTVDTRVRYAYEYLGAATVLTLEEIELRTVTNGKPTLEALMNRLRFHAAQDGKSKDYTADTADERIKSMLSDSFGAPLVKFAFDAAGKEIKRTQVAGPGAQAILKPEMIANTRCFHVPFHADKPKWDADVEIGGSNGIVAGIFTYTKVPAEKNDRGIVVHVLGDFQPEVQKTPAGQIVTKRSAAGEQTYSPELREWISGEWTIKMSIEMDGAGKRVGGGTGTVVAKMRLIADK